ncbi:hypothetical protein GTR02_18835 [Kineococcus sp. R8]|uniref:hypothetical protein n=1 Tax=Kineococcus siccus TaxID=2696567 RepID=UPI001412DFB8|nr:hypothetical protein [Kineococcus siccus]NAZ83870.1 hypothetical protein [Kineococcus siccus]
MEMPPRSPRLSDRLLATFDLDCGELIPGHRLIARGLADEGRSKDDFRGGTDNIEQQMIGLEYELVPGITAEEAAAAGVRDLIVDAGYSVDVPLVWSTGDERSGPSSQWKPTGGPSSAGQFGPHPLPAGAGRVRFTLHPVTAEGIAAGHPYGAPEPAGQVVIELGAGTARWDPA